MQHVRRMVTHNYRKSCKHDTVLTSWVRTYGFSVTEKGDRDQDEVHHGGVPVLQHRQARYSLRHLGCHTAMNNTNTVEVIV